MKSLKEIYFVVPHRAFVLIDLAVEHRESLIIAAEITPLHKKSLGKNALGLRWKKHFSNQTRLCAVGDQSD